VHRYVRAGRRFGSLGAINSTIASGSRDARRDCAAVGIGGIVDGRIGGTVAACASV
jgi:hypothetical protein